MAPPSLPSPDVTVLGSANMDLVLAVERYPSGGETVTAEHRGEAPGGKGLNQAVAAARTGAATAFVGCVGDDPHGRALLATMAEAGIDAASVRRSSAATGLAMIVLQPSGENTIYVVPGANSDALVDDSASRLIGNSRVLVAQLEIPLPTVTAGIAAARAAGTQVMLNAAPAVPVDDELLRMVDTLVVNEHEAVLLGRDDDPLRAAAQLSRTAGQTIVTLGAEGAVLVGADGPVMHVPGIRAEVVDTTAAGDTFVGALAAASAEGADIAASMRFAVAASALAVERRGAVRSIPTRAETEQRLRTLGG